MSDKHSDLRADFHIFESRLEEWLEDHKGKYVVMHKGQVVGFFDDYAAGLRAGLRTFGVTTEFLVQQVREEKPLLVI